MAKWHTLQSSFLEGEVSPRFVANVNSEFRKNALAEALNSVLLLQGSVTKRMGTNFILDLETGPLGGVRLWPFLDINNRQAISLWTAGLVRIVATLDDAPAPTSTPDKAQIAGYTQLVTNPTFALGLAGWNTSGKYVSGNVNYDMRPALGDLVLYELRVNNNRPNSFDDVFIQQPVLITETTNSLIITFRAQKNLTNPQPGSNTQMRVRIGSTIGGSDIIERFYDVDETLNTTAESIILPGGISGQLYVECAMVVFGISAGTTTSEDYRIFLTDFFLYAQTDDVLIVDSVSTPYGDNALEALHFIQSPFDQQELIVLHPEFPPHALFFDGEYKFEVYAFVEPEPPIWGPNNHPSLAAEFQGRLMLSGAINNPETIWGSASFDWRDFEDAGQPTPEDSIEFTSTARGVNTWMAGFKRFLFGNTTDEFDLAIEGRVLTPNDIGIQQQSSYGSQRVPQKITIGNSLLFATGGNTALRMMRFSEENGGFVSPDRFLKAEHLGRKIIRHHFHTRDPHEMVWCVMLDGSVSIMSFDEEMSVYSWTHFVTDGRFIDGVSIVDQAGRDVVILVVERVINGVTKKYLEIINDLRNVQNWQYLDSHTRTFIEGDQLIVGGLDYLEAKEVDVFTDDNYLGKRVVINGQIEIDAPAAFVDVGLAYDFRCVTLPEPSLQSGVGLTAKKRFSKIGIRGVFTRPPIIQGQRPPDRAPQALMDIPQPAEILLDSSIVDLNWNENGSVVIQEPLPLRITIAGIFGRLTSNEV